VDLDIEKEVVAVIGSKEGLAHLALVLIDEGDMAIVPNPTFPIHIYSIVLAGGNVVNVPMTTNVEDFLRNLIHTAEAIWPKPAVMYLSFPHNPTTAVVDLEFFKEAVSFAKKNNMYIIHDFAYCDIVFDDYEAPSILQVAGAKDCCVEFTTMSKSFNMAGWRCGFAVGNPKLLAGLAKIKGYYDYGIFQAIQIASIIALRDCDDAPKEIATVYQQRRDALCRQLERIGWPIPKPRGSMFAWAPIPEPYREIGSIEFSMKLLEEAEVAVAPGIGFGDLGDGYVRIALVENENRITQAVRQIGRALKLKTSPKAPATA